MQISRIDVGNTRLETQGWKRKSRENGFKLEITEKRTLNRPRVSFFGMLRMTPSQSKNLHLHAAANPASRLRQTLKSFMGLIQ